ncbi:protein kinase C and casein kinase substrate in neurons protein 2 [Periophthalmus magnuspinnatus]|uniref:protein kinase C and casein kinase substrate in neurons protein 2 n=1 Tax=Periophthalmus magnuspinnatus TaxID=409849 RepID=UPI00145B07C1|nr:protein kinase C and casein kinase substrate in neurons protein 2 [Periophthalmus magnuspinnatus]
MSSEPTETSPEDVNHRSFWMPGNYQRTVRRTEDSFQACTDMVSCFQERARVERQYAQALSEWSQKWRPVVDSSPLYGSLMKAWQCFMSSADRLASLHASMCRALVSEDGDRVRTWQKDNFHKKVFGGFKETQEIETGFARAQKPWTKKLKKLDKARQAFHKASRREYLIREREAHAQGNPDVNIDKQKKLQEDLQLASQEVDKMRSRYEKVLEEVNRYAPRYMEEMESVFDQSQDEEKKRIMFLKQALLSIHDHLDVTTNESVRSVYSELHNTLMSIDEQEDLRWWKNTHGPGMPTDWPHFQEYNPEKKPKPKKGKKEVKEVKEVKDVKEVKAIKQVDTGTIEKSVMIGGVKVRALYDYVGQETDELSFKAGEEFLKIEDEDDQGWCRGMKDGQWEGLYPANYVEVV